MGLKPEAPSSFFLNSLSQSAIARPFTPVSVTTPDWPKYIAGPPVWKGETDPLFLLLEEELVEEGPGRVRGPLQSVAAPAVEGAEDEVHASVDSGLRQRVSHRGGLRPGDESVLGPLDEQHRGVARIDVADRRRLL